MLLKRRRLGQLALISVMVILIGAAVGFILENGAPGSQIDACGDALWWSATIVTNVASEIYPVTLAGASTQSIYSPTSSPLSPPCWSTWPPARPRKSPG